MLKKSLAGLIIAQLALSTSYGLSNESIHQKLLSKHLLNNNQLKTSIPGDSQPNTSNLNIFNGDWVGKCVGRSFPPMSEGVYRIDIGTIFEYGKDGTVDNGFYFDNKVYSLGNINIDISSKTFGQQVTKSILHLEDDNKLVLTEEKTYNHNGFYSSGSSSGKPFTRTSYYKHTYTVNDDKLEQVTEYSDSAGPQYAYKYTCTYTDTSEE